MVTRFFAIDARIWRLARDVRANVLYAAQQFACFKRFDLYYALFVQKYWVRCNMDRFDEQILLALQDNARISNVQLAERVGLSASACSRRIQALEELGVIAGYRAVLDREQIGLPMTVLVNVSIQTLSRDQMAAFESAVMDIPEVIVCYLVSGSSDYLLRIAARDLPDFERIHTEHLSTLPFVARIESNFALREVVNRSP